MKLIWLFGNSLEAHHLLASYIAVWLIQGGYAAWILSQWQIAGRKLKPELALVSEDDEDS